MLNTKKINIKTFNSNKIWTLIKEKRTTLMWASGVLVLWVVIPQLFLRHCPWLPILSGFFGPTNELESLFAPINTLFSGFAFVALLVTIYEQRESVENQLWLQEKAIAEDRERSYKQSFENNFFQLLTLHNSNVENIRIDSSRIFRKGEKAEGKSAFFELYHLLTSIRDLYSKDENISKKTMLTFNHEWAGIINRAVDNIGKKRTGENAHLYIFNEYTRNILSQCHRHIYHILKYIDDSTLSDTEKQSYVRILRAQFSNHEFAILFYTTLLHKEDKFKTRIEKYAFMHNLDKGFLLKCEDQLLYEETAYGDKGYENPENINEYSRVLDFNY